MEAQTTFHRFEKKYLLSPLCYRRLLQKLKERMAEDEYGHYTITSVYFDTDDFAIVRSSMQGPVFKEKLRLRWYGEKDESSEIFWEIKRKYHGMVYKRRIPLRSAGAIRLLQPGSAPGHEQIAKEVEWFITRYHPVPKLLLAYDREALASPQEPGLRITFDRNIRWRDKDFKLASGSYGTPLMRDDMVLMEIKAYGSLPVWLTGLLAAEKIYPTSFSKYGTWYETIHLRKGRNQDVG